MITFWVHDKDECQVHVWGKNISQILFRFKFYMIRLCNQGISNVTSQRSNTEKIPCSPSNWSSEVCDGHEKKWFLIHLKNAFWHCQHISAPTWTCSLFYVFVNMKIREFCGKSLVGWRLQHRTQRWRQIVAKISTLIILSVRWEHNCVIATKTSE